jgi:hypothetical protein
MSDVDSGAAPLRRAPPVLRVKAGDPDAAERQRTTVSESEIACTRLPLTAYTVIGKVPAEALVALLNVRIEFPDDESDAALKPALTP